MPTAWDFVTDAAIPSIAILVSTGIALLLAASERKRATAARSEERAEAAAARASERKEIEADRENERRTRILEQLIEIYGFFIAAHPTAESWLPVMRQLRAKLIVLQTMPSARALAEWLVSQQPRGQLAMQQAMQNPYLNAPEDPAYMRWHAPMADWANEMINAIASWMRGDISDEEIRATLRRDAEAADGARRGEAAAEG